MKIENRNVQMPYDYLSSVTYVPAHAQHNATHPDCEQGVIIKLGKDTVNVLYCKYRTVQATNPDDLVWG